MLSVSNSRGPGKESTSLNLVMSYGPMVPAGKRLLYQFQLRNNLVKADTLTTFCGH